MTEQSTGHALAFMRDKVGEDNYRDIVTVFDGLSRLASRGAMGSDLRDAFIEALADDLVQQQIANDVASGLLPAAGNSADTARSEDTCNNSSSG